MTSELTLQTEDLRRSDQAIFPGIPGGEALR